LKSSERSLASLARDNEDKIVQLQNKVDDMNNEVIKQRREIQEYKSKEKNSLEQISTVRFHTF
jgi:predicted  nucleic acid-binding Zn-ribbon protein